jgi:hypothetical protein
MLFAPIHVIARSIENFLSQYLLERQLPYVTHPLGSNGDLVATLMGVFDGHKTWPPRGLEGAAI